MEKEFNQIASTQRLWRLVFFLILSWLPVLFSSDTVASVSSLHSFAVSAHPYFVPGQAVRFYLWTPVVVLSGCLLLLSPGLFLALATGKGRSFSEWLLYSLPLNLVGVSAVAALSQLFIGRSVTGNTFLLVLVVYSIAAFFFLIVRMRKKNGIPWPLEEWKTPALTAALFFVLLVGLFPKFFWENFHGDGVHAFEPGRLLLKQSFPFWPPGAGWIGSYPGLTTMLHSFPVSWFIRIFGENEASARLPYLIFICTLFSAIRVFVRMERKTTFFEDCLMAAGAFLFAIVLAFNATYNPYMADIALPAAREALLMVLFTGYLIAFVRKETFWMALFLVLCFVHMATIPMLVALWIGAVFLTMRPRRWREMLQTCGIVLGGMIVAAFAQGLITSMTSMVPGGEFSAQGMIDRFSLMRRPAFRRVAFLVIPSGIVPAFSFLFWKKQDAVNRALIIVTVIYFGLFSVQQQTALHHYVPVMILPVIVFWRTRELFDSPYRRTVLFSTGVAIVAAVYLSIPSNTRPDTSGRMIGAKIEDRTEGYKELSPKAFKRGEMLAALFKDAWHYTVPQENYGGSWLAWLYYAHHGERADPNYILMPVSETPSVEWTLVTRTHDAALYVKNKAEWEKDQHFHPPTPATSKIFRVTRKTLFKRDSK